MKCRLVDAGGFVQSVHRARRLACLQARHTTAGDHDSLGRMSSPLARSQTPRPTRLLRTAIGMASISGRFTVANHNNAMNRPGF